jgi:hypothetical protein
LRLVRRHVFVSKNQFRLLIGYLANDAIIGSRNVGESVSTGRTRTPAIPL